MPSVAVRAQAARPPVDRRRSVPTYVWVGYVAWALLLAALYLLVPAVGALRSWKNASPIVAPVAGAVTDTDAPPLTVAVA